MARTYEGIESYAYLDLTGRNLGIKGIAKIMEDLSFDDILQHVNFSNNIAQEEITPKNMSYLMKMISRHLSKNKVLTALDLSGNHLFDFTPHPNNEHKKNYVLELTKAVQSTHIRYLNISDNNITGNLGREFKGLIDMMENFGLNANAFTCKFNKLDTQGLIAICQGLGSSSTLTYLDISDNFCGSNPLKLPSTEGVVSLAQSLVHSIHLKVLKIARNFLLDDDIVIIANALQQMPQFQDLDISGNCCNIYGTEAINYSLICHSAFHNNKCGIRSLNLSNNLLNLSCINLLSEGLQKIQTLEKIDFTFCGLNEECGIRLKELLSMNSSIVSLDISNNLISEELEIEIQAEVMAMKYITLLRENVDSIDVSELSSQEYMALSRKLRFLSSEQLTELHNNPTFNEEGTELRESLHNLQPPPRKLLLKEVLAKNSRLVERLERSSKLDKKLTAARIIYGSIIPWYEKVKAKKSIQKVLLMVMQKEQENNVRNTDDDRFH